MRTLITILLVTIAVGCSISSKDTAQLKDREHIGLLDDPAGPEYPIKNAEGVFTVVIRATNYTAEEKAKLVDAMELIRRIFNSVEYKQAVLSHTVNGVQTFDSNNGLTNLQIYEKLFGGAEALSPAVNYQMDLVVTMYYRPNSVIGYTTQNSNVVKTNRRFHSHFKPCRVASNLTHEWTHKMGFGHRSASEKGSVPYAHNTIIESLCEKAENGSLTPLK